MNLRATITTTILIWSIILSPFVAKSSSQAFLDVQSDLQTISNASFTNATVMDPGPSPRTIAPYGEATFALSSEDKIKFWGVWGESVKPAPVLWPQVDGNAVQVVAGGAEQNHLLFFLDSLGAVHHCCDSTGATNVVTGLESSVVDVSTSQFHSCATLENGKVMCWGENYGGSIGIPNGNPDTGANIPDPIEVAGVTGAKATSLGYNFSCSLNSDGGVLCWGSNSAGQLGNLQQPLQDDLPPTQPDGLNSAVVRIVASERGFFACALKSDGTVWCWGSINGSNSPVQVPGIEDAVLIAAGSAHACAVQADNEVKCWGSNVVGQLGDGTNDNHSEPVLVEGLNFAQITDIESGDQHTCVRTQGGNLWCWGLSRAGQLGDGVVARVPSPTLVDLSLPVAQFAPAEWSSCIRTNDGNVQCWGDNSSGQLGNGNMTPSGVPVEATGLTSGEVTDLKAGSAFMCILTNFQGVACWGAFSQNVPALRNGLENGIKQLEVGSDHVCVLTVTGDVGCFWANNMGQSGQPIDPDHSVIGTATEVAGLTSGVAQIAVGSVHSCARKLDGTVWCWGDASNGQLGDSITNPTGTPVHVVVGGVSLDDITDVKASGNHTCATHSDQSVVCWGDSEFMDLWKASLINQVNAVSGGYYHTCYLTISGGVRCKGSNEFGQLGTGNFDSSDEYLDVPGLLSKVVQLGGGGYHTCALLDTNQLQCWGADEFGQLADSNPTFRPYPVPVIGFSGFPELGVNYYTGQPGSFFKIMGTNFPVNSAVELYANETDLGQVMANEDGTFIFMVTTPLENSGYYTISAQSGVGGAGVKAALHSLVNQSLTIRSSAGQPLRIKEGTAKIYSIPQGIAFSMAFIPMIFK